MSTEQSKTIVRRFFEEGINKRNEAVVEELLAANYACIENGVTKEGGRDGQKQVIGAFLSAFPDLQVRLDELIAEGDKVVALKTYSGTQRGDLMGMRASGKRVTVPEASFFRIADGKIAEEWDYSDQLSFMQQLGALPTEEGHPEHSSHGERL